MSLNSVVKSAGKYRRNIRSGWTLRGQTLTRHLQNRYTVHCNYMYNIRTPTHCKVYYYIAYMYIHNYTSYIFCAIILVVYISCMCLYIVHCILQLGLCSHTCLDPLQEVTESDELILMYRFYYHMILERYMYIHTYIQHNSYTCVIINHLCVYTICIRACA